MYGSFQQIRKKLMSRVGNEPIILIFLAIGLSWCNGGFSQNEDPEDSCWFYLEKTQNAFDQAEFDHAILYAKLAEKHNPMVNDTTNSLVYFFLSRSYYFLGTYDKAVETNIISLKYAVSMRDSVSVGVRYNQFGNIYTNLKNFEQAAHYFFMAKDIFRLKKHLEYEAVALSNIATLYAEQQEYEKQFEYNLMVLHLYRRQKDTLNIAKVLNNIGTYYDRIDQLDSARWYYQKSLDIGEAINDQRGVIISIGNLGQLYAKNKNYDSAYFYMNKAINMATLAGDKHTVIHNYSNLFQLYGDFERYKDAYEVGVKLIEMKDSLYDEETNSRISNLQVLYETEQRETENRLLQSENKLKNERIKTKNDWIILLSIALFILLMAAIQIFVQTRKLKNANKELFRKNMEIVYSEKQLNVRNQELELELRSRTEDEGKEGEKYKGTELDETQKNEIVKKIYEAVEERKVYLDEEITLTSFANDLEISRTYLSMIINKTFKTNFNNFINEYRIKESRRMLASEEYSKYTIEAVGKKSGFKSRSAFNTAFKKFTGITPSYFIKTIRKNT